MDVALHLHKEPNFHGTVVTLNGEMIDANGFVTGGSLENNTSGLLARNREIEGLTSSVNSIQCDLNTLQKNIQNKKQTLSQLEENLRQLNQQVHTTDIAANNKLSDLEQY